MERFVSSKRLELTAVESVFFSTKKDPEKFVDNEPGAIKADFQLLVALEHTF